MGFSPIEHKQKRRVPSLAHKTLFLYLTSEQRFVGSAGRLNHKTGD